MNNYINNIILYFLVIIILHLLIKIYLLEEEITEAFIHTQPTLNKYIDENRFINNYDTNAKNELLGYLDNDKSSNNLSTDKYTFDKVPTLNYDELNKKKTNIGENLIENQETISENNNTIKAFDEAHNTYYTF